MFAESVPLPMLLFQSLQFFHLLQSGKHATHTHVREKLYSKSRVASLGAGKWRCIVPESPCNC